MGVLAGDLAVSKPSTCSDSRRELAMAVVGRSGEEGSSRLHS